jgi:hypothetical protein
MGKAIFGHDPSTACRSSKGTSKDIALETLDDLRSSGLRCREQAFDGYLGGTGM